MFVFRQLSSCHTTAEFFSRKLTLHPCHAQLFSLAELFLRHVRAPSVCSRTACRKTCFLFSAAWPRFRSRKSGPLLISPVDPAAKSECWLAGPRCHASVTVPAARTNPVRGLLLQSSACLPSFPFPFLPPRFLSFAT